MKMLRYVIPYLVIVIGELLLIYSSARIGASIKVFDSIPSFNGLEALDFVKTQVAFGPRIPGSPAHLQMEKWLILELRQMGWEVTLQSGLYSGQPVENIIASRGNGHKWTIFGAHYDSRMIADQDINPDLQLMGVPGANDGASGVAILLELAKVLPKDDTQKVSLLFLDSEDQGNIPGWDWIIGSRFFVSHLKGIPDRFILLDMVGDKNLDLYYERNSNPQLMTEIWKDAASLGYQDQFIPEYKYSMLDDHIPFIQAGIPSVDIIDFDYPYWHTTGDTPDKVSEKSLQVVGETLMTWLSGER
jgi:glutaminyl-peptide cyclotransferase